MASNTKNIKFKHTLIEEDLVMFLEDVLIKNNMETFSAPDEMDVRVLGFFIEFDMAQSE